MEDDEFERVRIEHARKAEEITRRKDAFEKEINAQLPPKLRAEKAWEDLKANTPLSEEQKNATAEQKENWNQQEQDSKHVQGNAYTASEQNQFWAEMTDLSKQSFSQDLSKFADEYLKEIDKKMERPTEERRQAESQKQTIRQKP